MKITKITDSSIEFDEKFILRDYHEQDCSELVYADFSYVEGCNLSTATGEEINLYDIDFPCDIESLVKGVKAEQKGDTAGFNLIALDGSKFFVPCYDIQNGCYEGDLTLFMYDSTVKDYEKSPIGQIDLSDYTTYKNIEEDDYEL